MQVGGITLPISAVLVNETVGYADAVQRTGQQKWNDAVSVMDFGADNTGADNSAAAFTAARATGKCVFVPKGTYNLNGDAVTYSTDSYLTEFRAGNSSLPASDNNVMAVGDNYDDDVNPLVDSIHNYSTVGRATFTAAGNSGNDYDTSRIYGGVGVWGHHNHFQTGTEFEDNVEFANVWGLAGSITLRDNARVNNYQYIAFNEPTIEDSGSYGQATVVYYPNSHYASDMTNIISANQNYALEVRRYLLDPTTAYAASVFTEGQATFKAISASDNETSPYNVDGSLNTNLDRYNCRVGAGLDGYFRFTNGTNSWRVGQAADSLNMRIYTLAGTAAGMDFNNCGVHSLNSGALAAWNNGNYGFQLDKCSIFSTGGADLFMGSNFYYDGANYKRIAAIAASRIASVGGVITLLAGDAGAANGNITWTEALRMDGNGHIIMPLRTPASAAAAGTAGEICYDANYIYICTAANTWKRVAIATW